MGQVLTIRADFILTLYDQYASVAQYSVSLATALLIKFYNRSVPLPAASPRCFMSVGIVVSKGIVCPRACFGRVPAAEEPFHVGWVKDERIEGLTFIRKIATVCAVRDI